MYPQRVFNIYRGYRDKLYWFFSLQVPPEHVISASFMSAPAALAIAKISLPETEVSNIRTQKEIKLPAGYVTHVIYMSCHVHKILSQTVTMQFR